MYFEIKCYSNNKVVSQTLETNQNQNLRRMLTLKQLL